MNIRPTKHDDLADLQEVLDGTELFPREMLPDMVSSFLSGDDGSDLWLTCEVDGKAVGFLLRSPRGVDRLCMEQACARGTALASG